MNEQNRQDQTLPRDPLIQEVRDMRRELSNRFGNDVTKLCDYLREIESQYPGRVVAPPRRRWLPGE